MADLPRAWWHGCWLSAGHYLFDRNGRSLDYEKEGPPGMGYAPWLDGSLAPRRYRSGRSWPIAPLRDDGLVFGRMAKSDDGLYHRIMNASDEAPQGDFLLHAIAGCTIAAWWDRTQGDTRGACNSCLIVENQCPQLFPRQADRLAAAGVELRFLRWAS